MKRLEDSYPDWARKLLEAGKMAGWTGEAAPADSSDGTFPKHEWLSIPPPFSGLDRFQTKTVKLRKNVRLAGGSLLFSQCARHGVFQGITP